MQTQYTQLDGVVINNTYIFESGRTRILCLKKINRYLSKYSDRFHNNTGRVFLFDVFTRIKPRFDGLNTTADSI